MKKDNTEYKTRDISEAAAFICSNAKLIKLEEDQDFYWFVFSDPNCCEELSNKYWFGELLVNCRTYQQTLRSLKNKIFKDGRFS